VTELYKSMVPELISVSQRSQQHAYRALAALVIQYATFVGTVVMLITGGGIGSCTAKSVLYVSHTGHSRARLAVNELKFAHS
jgi:hypothetical protein